ncbi:acyltransferase [Agrilactobacillus fermenti]|uniref:acyltransferase n=1 Tax=Agrilactobacillus fermenti TaxID=2586909 RepID=UPI001E3D3AD1|nr:acyltransferase [Agrilactobacillus fermenti]MCD2257330.1 acyltransferase [Agrilactobacillus fermenti]
MVEKSQRIIYIDFIRIISMLGVILLHVSAVPLRDKIGTSSWHIANLLTTIATPAVPLFFMISGALLLHSRRTADLKYVWRHRILKLFMPFLLWSIIAILVYGRYKHTLTPQSFWQAIVAMPNVPTAEALWFMYPMFVLYILSPILRQAITALSQKMLQYFLLIWLITNSVLPTIATYVPQNYKVAFNFNSYWALVGGYLGYFVLGYYLRTYGLTKLKKWHLCLINCLLVLLVTLETYGASLQMHQYNDHFKDYVQSLPILFLSVGIFLLWQKVDFNLSARTQHHIRSLAQLSYGVYLIHNLIVLVITDPLYTWWHLPITLQLSLNFVIATTLSLSIIWIITKIPIVRFLLAGEYDR